MAAPTMTATAVIAVIAKHDLVTATGHVSPSEALLLLGEGRRQGAAHMGVTHAMNPPVSMDIAQMQAAEREGSTGMLRSCRRCVREGSASTT